LHLIVVVELAVTVAWIQECGENPMFHLQSQWSPKASTSVFFSMYDDV
jgi:hypothetical protein